MATKRVELWFDYSSPFAYLATTQIERIAGERRAEVAWRPFLLGALFRAIGTPLVPLGAMPRAKRDYYLRDLERWASHYGVPFRFTPRFPIRTIAALRLTLLAESPPALVHRIMHACWVEGADPDAGETLRACARDAGVDEALAAETSTDRAKDLLRRATDDAIARGVPGAPSFVVGDELFWGQDRLSFVDHALVTVPRPPSRPER